VGAATAGRLPGRALCRPLADPSNPDHLNFLRYLLLMMTNLFQRHGAQPTRRHWHKRQPVVAQQQQLGLFEVGASQPSPAA
jgi:hypothetical protein